LQLLDVYELDDEILLLEKYELASSHKSSIITLISLSARHRFLNWFNMSHHSCVVAAKLTEYKHHINMEREANLMISLFFLIQKIEK
jgi:hypothetical protein